MQSRSRLARGNCYDMLSTRSDTCEKMQVLLRLCDSKQESKRMKLGPTGLRSSLPFRVLAASLRHLPFISCAHARKAHDGHHGARQWQSLFTDRDSRLPDSKSTMTCITLRCDRNHHVLPSADRKANSTLKAGPATCEIDRFTRADARDVTSGRCVGLRALEQRAELDNTRVTPQNLFTAAIKITVASDREWLRKRWNSICSRMPCKKSRLGVNRMSYRTVPASVRTQRLLTMLGSRASALECGHGSHDRSSRKLLRERLGHVTAPEDQRALGKSFRQVFSWRSPIPRSCGPLFS